MKARTKDRLWWAVAVLLVVAAYIAFPAAILCEPAEAAEASRDKFTFRQYLPAYIGTNYSNASDWSKEDTPYIRTQVSFAISFRPVTVAGLDVRPEIGYTWRAMLWPVGAESSPIQENNYLPEAWLSVNAAGANDQLIIYEVDGELYEKIVWKEDVDGLYRGSRVGYVHQSTGTDSASGSWDRLAADATFGRSLVIAGKNVEITGTVRAWYVLQTGQGTDGLLDYVNFKSVREVGGEISGTIKIIDLLEYTPTLGLSYQNHEIYIPLAPSWGASIFGLYHHGNFERMTNYGERPDAGIIGIAYEM